MILPVGNLDWFSWEVLRVSRLSWPQLGTLIHESETNDSASKRWAHCRLQPWSKRPTCLLLCCRLAMSCSQEASEFQEQQGFTEKVSFKPMSFIFVSIHWPKQVTNPAWAEKDSFLSHIVSFWESRCQGMNTGRERSCGYFLLFSIKICMEGFVRCVSADIGRRLGI